MELIKDYELVIEYHPEKANMVVDALSRKSSTTLSHIRTAYVPLFLDIKALGISLDYDGYGALLVSFVVNKLWSIRLGENRYKMKNWSKKLVKL